MREKQDSGGLHVACDRLDVLCIEDDDLYAKTLERLILEVGDVHVARSIGDAMQMLKAIQFDVIVLDLGLPDATDLDGVRQLHARTEIPIIVLTGRFGGEKQDRAFQDAAIEAGADDYLLKGVGGYDLRSRLRFAVGRQERAQARKKVGGGPAG